VITYEVAGPTDTGDYLIGYATPGAPALFTVACTASCQRGAIDAAARLNKAAAERDAEAVKAWTVQLHRAADFLAIDMAAALEGMP
jgi:hypothetical protein